MEALKEPPAKERLSMKHLHLFWTFPLLGLAMHCGNTSAGRPADPQGDPDTGLDGESETGRDVMGENGSLAVDGAGGADASRPDVASDSPADAASDVEDGSAESSTFCGTADACYAGQVCLTDMGVYGTGTSCVDVPASCSDYCQCPQICSQACTASGRHVTCNVEGPP
jgi:hypothetical protein